MHKDIKRVVFSREFERALIAHRNDRNFIKRVETQIEKLLREPALGKPLRYSLKNRRRIHVGSFVIVYELCNNELRFLDLDHHDKVYKRH